MQAQLGLIEAQGSLELRARAHLLLADTLLRAAAPEHLPAVLPEVERSMARAIACCEAADWWTKGEDAATLLACVRRAAGDVDGCEAAAHMALSFADRLAAAGCGIVM